MKLLSAWAAFLLEWSEASTLSAVVADHTTYNRSKGSLPGPRQHACCYFDSVWSEDDTLVMKAEEAGTGTLFVTHPHPLNHTSSVLIDCTILGLGSSNPECKRCKEYAVCQYCRCIADITFVRRRVSTLPYAGDEMAREIMELLGRRRPVGLSHAVDTGEGRAQCWVVLDGTLSDPSVSLWSEITYHRDKLYLRDIRFADYQFHPRDLSVWEVDPVTCERVLEIKTESEVTCFDVFSRDENLLVAYISPIHPAELRVDYHSLSQADRSKRRLMDDYIARCFHVPMFTEALGITLVDVALDGLGEMLSTVNLDCNPGDFISSIEISPCGHVVCLGVSSPSKEPSPGREVAVVY
ncbi:hypothetical protein FOZ60_012580 [Perkinsus olseni]|uniref:Uncharacterized protein n=1 Tax=Perkinsus olseni TaxID=32597 RepID=A0A7J6NCA6_PEROL|nr:hypothetical protein FOZ60_012580 [Perkinsus olseni]